MIEAQASQIDSAVSQFRDFISRNVFSFSYPINATVLSGFVTNDLKMIGSEIEKRYDGSFLIQDSDCDRSKPNFHKRRRVVMLFAFGLEQRVQECKRDLDKKFDTSGWLRLETRISDVPSKVMLLIQFL